MTENRCIEVLKKMKHMFTETCAKIDENTALNMAIEAVKENQQYKAIGTIDEFKALKEKSVKKQKSNKVKYTFDSYAYCPHCKRGIESAFMKPRHCSECHGELDWSE